MAKELPRPKEILLVEDDEEDGIDIKRLMEQLGVCNPVRWLKDGRAAMTYLSSVASASEAPTILLLDIRLPFFSGLDILETVQASPQFEQTLRIGCSGIDDPLSIKRAYELGAHSFLVKPVVMEQLLGLTAMFSGAWSLTRREGPGGRSQ